ncbi:dimethylargininase [Agromyces sp. MMS24-JH15]|uniref:dimethylargininase n=1 Tax=Agromyces sp. MMS24-JH15 TaxID=3243765 RepID=UPI0037479553
MTSPAPVVSVRPAVPRPARTPLRRVVAVIAASGAVAAVGFGAALLGLFIANGQSPDVFPRAAGHYFLAAVIAWILLGVSNGVGAARRWFLALLSGLASAVLAALLATTVTVLGANRPTPELFVFVLGSIVSLNLVFIVAVTLGEVFLAPAVLHRVLGWSPRRHARRIALVRIPASNLAEGELTHRDRVPIDQAKADDQWDNYCAALVAEGWETVEVDAAPELADSVFVEDAVVMFDDLAVLASPGTASRRGEVEGVERAVRSLPGIEVARIEAPGTLDGGDVLKVADTVYVGASARTNGEGIRQLRALLVPRGLRVVAVPVTKALHLKSTVTALPDGTVIGHPDLVDEPALFPRFVPVPEPEGVAVVALRDDTLLMSASAPRTAAMLAGFGYHVVTVDISEFEKLEGCVTCLSVRIR